VREEKSVAIQMRKEGKSYREINRLLNVPMRTLFSWFKGIKLSSEARRRIRDDARRIWSQNILNYNRKRIFIINKSKEEFKNKISKEIGDITERELMLIGVALYWAEGSKKEKWTINFSNSDPQIIRLMMLFFRRICKVKEDKFRAWIQIHPNISEGKAKNFWSKVTRIPPIQFNKTQINVSRSSKLRRNRDALPFGTVHVRISDVNLLNRIKGWILGLSKTNL